jgi:hypothetical protein
VWCTLDANFCQQLAAGRVLGGCAPDKIGNAKKESFQKWLFFLHLKHLENIKSFQVFFAHNPFLTRETHCNMSPYFIRTFNTYKKYTEI